MTAALKANGKTAEYNYDFLSGTTGIFQKSQKFCPSIQQFCPLKIEQNSDFQKIQKPATIAITGFVGGEGGIRTHVPLRTTAFRVRLVMTTSILLHIKFTGQTKITGSANIN